MTLEKLENELTLALKNKDGKRKLVMSSLVGAVKKATITATGRIEATEDLVNEVLLKEKKIAKEMIDTCPISREDLMNEYEHNYAIICEFAPQLITDKSEIENFIYSLNIELTKANRGLIMKNLKGKVDMKSANEVLGGIL